MKSIDPKTYNLPPRTKLLENNSGSLFVLIDRKSRVIMKDGHKIVKIAKDIKKINQNKFNRMREVNRSHANPSSVNHTI